MASIDGPGSPNATISTTSAEELAAAEDAQNNAALSILGNGSYVNPTTLIALLQHRMSDVDGQIKTLTEEIEATTTASKNMQEKLTAFRALEAAMSAAESKEGKNVDLEELRVGGVPALEFIEKNGLGEHIEYSNMPDAKFDGKARELIEEGGGEVDLVTLALHSHDSDSIGNHKYKHGEDIMNHLSAEAKDDGVISEKEYAEAFTAWQEEKAGDARQLNRSSLNGSIESVESDQRALNSGNELRMIKLQSVMQQRGQAISLATNMIKSLNDTNKTIVNNFR